MNEQVENELCTVGMNPDIKSNSMGMRVHAAKPQYTAAKR